MFLIRFEVPGQPQGKGRPRVGKVGGHARMFAHEKTVAYESLIALSARQARGSAPLLEGPLMVTLGVNCAIPKTWSKTKRAQALKGAIRPTTKPDADNTAKAVLDALNGVVWHDDTQVTTLIVVKMYSETPCLQVGVRRDE